MQNTSGPEQVQSLVEALYIRQNLPQPPLPDPAKSSTEKYKYYQ